MQVSNTQVCMRERKSYLSVYISFYACLVGIVTSSKGVLIEYMNLQVQRRRTVTICVMVTKLSNHDGHMHYTGSTYTSGGM